MTSSRDTALTIAADKGHYKFVELLLRCSACVDVKNKKGNSPLWLAANGGCGVLFVLISFRCMIVITYIHIHIHVRVHVQVTLADAERFVPVFEQYTAMPHVLYMYMHL